MKNKRDDEEGGGGTASKEKFVAINEIVKVFAVRPHFSTGITGFFRFRARSTLLSNERFDSVEVKRRKVVWRRDRRDIEDGTG